MATETTAASMLLGVVDDGDDDDDEMDDGDGDGDGEEEGGEPGRTGVGRGG